MSESKSNDLFTGEICYEHEPLSECFKFSIQDDIGVILGAWHEGMADFACTAIRSYYANKERIAELEANLSTAIARAENAESDFSAFRHRMCPICGGAGSVGNAPDDYYDCPECVGKWNKALREINMLRESLATIVTDGKSYEARTGKVISWLSNASAALEALDKPVK